MGLSSKTGRAIYLYISYDEQTERLHARMQDKDKTWKISAIDWNERKYWDDYQKAYEDILTQCNEIPWYIVPANHKWYRNLAVAHTLVATMRKYKEEWKADAVNKSLSSSNRWVYR